MWTTSFILSQVCVVFAVLSLALSVCTKNRVLILLLALSNSIFFGLQYLFLKEYTGAVLNFIGVIRGVWYFLNERFKANKAAEIVALVTCAALLVIGEILTFDAWYCIFPLMATMSYTVAVWQKNIKVYRWSIILVEICGVLYNIMVGSILGIVFEAILFVIAVVSVIKISIQTHREKAGGENIETTSSEESEKTPS